MLNPQDMQRLIDLITDEVLAAQGVGARCRASATATRRRWSAARIGSAACSTPVRPGSASMLLAARPAAWPG